MFYMGDDFLNCEKKIILCSTTEENCIMFDIIETETNKWSSDEIQRFISGFNKYLSSQLFNDSKFEFEVTVSKIGVKQFRIVTESEAGFIGSKSAFTSVLVR